MKKLLFLSIALCLGFQIMANSGKEQKPAPKDYPGQCTAYRNIIPGPIIILCTGNEGICKTVDGTSVVAYDCSLQGNWGTTLSPSTIRFTFSSYNVISVNPDKIEYTGINLK